MRKAYSAGGPAALGGVDLVAEPGELLALLGPSGSGKTTLLRVIAGLETPDAGRVYFRGEDVTGRPVQERRIGFVFQSYALFRHLTVAGNVAYGLKARRAGRPSRAAIARRVAELLDLVQLSDFAGRHPAQLSGGQRQRVALARALAVDPRVLLLDEPFGALDAQVRKSLRRWLKTVHRETGQTTIFVTHDQDEALELADRVAILNAGRLEQVGPPDAIYDDPASAFVMGFVGESARVPVEVAGAGEGGGRLVRLGGRVLPLRVPALPDGPADLYLRPTDLAIVPGDGGGDLSNNLSGRVRTVRRVGAGRRAEVRLDGAGADGAGVDVDVALTGAPPAVGDAVALALVGGRVFPRRGG